MFSMLHPRVIEMGKIKIGGKDPTARKVRGSDRTWRAPIKLDHFRVTTLMRDAKGDLIQDAALMESLAEYADDDGHLRQLPITVLSDDLEDVLQCAWVWYAGKHVAARSDGKEVEWFVNRDTGKILDTPLREEWKDEYAELANKSGKIFKLHSVLSCVIAAKASRWGGVYKFRTTSRISADQLYSSLLHLKGLTGGVLRGLPLRLIVRPMQVKPQGKASTVYVVHVEMRGDDLQAVQQQALQLAQFQLANAEQMRATQVAYKRMLKAPGDGESVVESADVSEEFHPESVETEKAPPAEPDPLLAGMEEKPMEADELGDASATPEGIPHVEATVDLSPPKGADLFGEKN